MSDRTVRGDPKASHGEAHPSAPEESMPLRELDSYARAEVALHRIRRGSDPALEAFDLANTLNDEWTRRVAARIRRWFRRR
ncbi:hypothetical protein [Curtobacterium ammoniigenes]|uniref:hypothetical protein n=1 Tax=Curtobacterium ammoniigenes TaxID=395387 RepID=UPI000832E99E|nr:hypothetical protein [Curtobacterium ammoniigenes]